MVETLDAFEDFFLAQAGKLERALLETVAFDEIGLVLLHKPAVELGLFVKFRARIRRGEGNLQTEHVEFLRETN